MRLRVPGRHSPAFVRSFSAVSQDDGDHLTDVQVLEWVKSTADDVEREVIGSHIEVCNRCAEITSDVKKLLATPAVKTRAVARGIENRTWLLAAAAIIIGALGSGWLFSLPYRREVSRLEARLEETERSNEDLRGKLAAAPATSNGSAASSGGCRIT